MANPNVTDQNKPFWPTRREVLRIAGGIAFGLFMIWTLDPAKQMVASWGVTHRWANLAVVLFIYIAASLVLDRVVISIRKRVRVAGHGPPDATRTEKT